jgi:hypothetical protein
MKMKHKIFKKTLPFAAILVIVLAFAFSGCQTQPATTEHTDGEHDTEHEHETEHEHGDRLPNDGAVIHIISPTGGTTFASGDEIVVEVEVTDFDLAADGSHWHLYVDGTTWSQVVGGGTKEVIRGLEPGEHHIEVYLGLPTHEELEDGDMIMITVTE